MKTLKYHVEFSFCIAKHLLFGFIPFGKNCGLGWTELTFNHKVLTVNQIERELVRLSKLRGEKNPHFLVMKFTKVNGGEKK